MLRNECCVGYWKAGPQSFLKSPKQQDSLPRFYGSAAVLFKEIGSLGQRHRVFGYWKAGEDFVRSVLDYSWVL